MSQKIKTSVEIDGSIKSLSGLIGASANLTRFPNATFIVSTTPSGVQHNESLYIGTISESVSVGSTWASGIYGAGYTNPSGTGRGTGVTGEGHVSTAADTGVAVGVRGYANDIHTGNYNIGLYGDAENGDAGLTYGGNVALFLANGSIVTSSSAAKQWYLGGNLIFNGQGSVKTISVTNGAKFDFGGTSSQFIKGDGTLDSNSYYLASNPNGYISSYTETDPTVPSYVKSITSTEKSNWNTAYGWGNHASAGYLTTSLAASTYVSLSGNYSNPSWITGLAWSKITGAPAFITSYTETDTLASVTARGASTSTLSTFDGGLNIGNAKLRCGTTTSPTLGFPFTGGPNAFWIDVNDGDTGGLAIDNDGTTIYGAGDSGHVFRVIDEDVYQATTNIDASTTFRIQQGQNGGGYIRGNFEITGTLSASGYNKTNWDTAYGWGNHASAGYVPSSRTITINGTSYDLSANRSWTVTASETDTLATVTARGASTTGAITVNGNMTSTGTVFASGTGGFASSTYIVNSRNPIWRFGNADGYGLSYFQATAGDAGQDTIGFHFGTATSAGSQFKMRGDGTFLINGSVTLHTGNYLSYAWPVEGGWKPASLASSTRLRGATSPDGGEFALAYSGGQIHPYTDGFFYQNEGAYRVMDSNSIGDYTVGNYRTIADYSSDSTWYMRPNGRFVFANAHDWTQTFELLLPSGGSNNNTWAHFGQRQSNTTNGNFTGVSIRRYISGASNLGDLQAGNMYGRILYDDDNTGYYLDPASTSNFNLLTMANKITLGSFANSTVNSGSAWIGRASDRSNGTMTVQLGSATSTKFEVVDYAWTTIAFEANGYGTATASSSLRAPAFYDSNDTTYYADLAATSDAAMKIRGGTIHGPNPTWGAYLLVGGDGRQNYTNSTTTASVCVSNGNLHIDAASGFGTYLNFYDGSVVNFGDGSNSVVSTINTDGSHRPQIIYDYNNTSYYVNPDGASRMGTINADLLRSYGNLYLDYQYGATVVGVYNAARFQGVFAMGDSYKLATDGTNCANHYGIAWSHPNAGGQAANLSSHGMLIQAAGTTWSAISNTIWCIGDIIAYSDAKVKDNVKIIDNPLERIKKVRGVTFTRNDFEDKEKRYAGVIAQEMREALPEVVSENSEGNLSVSYGNSISLLIECIKEQQAQIDELKQLVNQLINK